MNKNCTVVKKTLLQKFFWHFRNEDKPFSWMMSRVLFYSGFGRFFTINCGKYSIRFFPSGISLAKWSNPKYNINDENILSSLLAPGDVFIDVGANVGTLSLTAASLVGEGGKVYCFEPNRRIFDYLCKNIRLNSFANVIPSNCVVGEKPGEVFFSDQSHDDINKVVSAGSHKLPMTTIDAIAEQISGNIKLLKIDVEGYEKFVLQGSENTLCRIDNIYFEAFDEHFTPYGYTTSNILNYLGDFGFSFFRFDEDGREVAISCKFEATICMNILAKRQGLRHEAESVESCQNGQNHQ
jgi:FkbM family methyltransferase